MNEYLKKYMPRFKPKKTLSENASEIKARDKNDFWDWGARKLTLDESYDQQKAREENERYWMDYTKNTGTEPLYPYRVGKEGHGAPAQYEQIMGTGAGPNIMKKLYGGMS